MTEDALLQPLHVRHFLRRGEWLTRPELPPEALSRWWARRPAAVACASAGFGWAAAIAARRSLAAPVWLRDRGDGLAGGASGLGFGTGTPRLATCGIGAGGRGSARLTVVGGGNAPGGP